MEPKRQKVDHTTYESLAQILLHTLSDKWVALHFEATQPIPGGEFHLTVYHSHTPDVELPSETIEQIKADCALIRSAVHWVTEIKIRGFKDW